MCERQGVAEWLDTWVWESSGGGSSGDYRAKYCCLLSDNWSLQTRYDKWQAGQLQSHRIRDRPKMDHTSL